jgi:hypothetical protein
MNFVTQIRLLTKWASAPKLYVIFPLSNINQRWNLSTLYLDNNNLIRYNTNIISL